MQLSLSLPVNFCTRNKKQETRHREKERKTDPSFFRTFLITPFQLFRQVQFPATRRKKRKKRELHVDDQDGVRSSLARKSAGLSLHNNIIIGKTTTRINEDD